MNGDPLVGKLVGGRFFVEERIGEGGYTVIYRATQQPIERPVALKVLAAHVAADPSWVARFHVSARHIAQVSHPHLMQVFDHGVAEGFHYVAGELLAGHSLRRELDRVGHLDVRRALEIIAPTCRALQAIHDHGIVLRDVKPETIYLCGDDGGASWVKLLFSTILKVDDPESPKTRPGVVFGTPWYMSPEQVQGKPLGPTSDLYAVGLVLYEAIAGYKAFDDESATEVALKQLRAKAPPLPERVPGLVAAIIERALAKRPQDRPQSGDDLARECEAALAILSG